MGAGRVERAERLLVDDADRRAEDLAGLEALVRQPAGPLRPAGRELVGAVAETLERSAAVLAAGSSAQGAAALDARTDAYAADVSAARDLAGGMDVETLTSRSRRAVTLVVIGRVAAAAAAHGRIALGEAVDGPVAGFAGGEGRGGVAAPPAGKPSRLHRSGCARACGSA